MFVPSRIELVSMIPPDVRDPIRGVRIGWTISLSASVREAKAADQMVGPWVGRERPTIRGRPVGRSRAADDPWSARSGRQGLSRLPHLGPPLLVGRSQLLDDLGMLLGQVDGLVEAGEGE